ncbi:hypothetical protein ACFPVT_08085 [Corynebacterium choanae]|uniref:Uncharacterized protein n=1 Tax=Corynebacterium choanae TaxID=1862358 RepID=A0A3G6J8H3_9CORY|nr:hypothetical protein [Corynebacterium choanae]AZA14073.1 hypothetical protein CCHOA_08420 [Corynebacterium choanae]
MRDLDAFIQWLIAAPLWIQAPIVFVVLVVLCVGIAMVWQRLIDVVGIRLGRRIAGIRQRKLAKPRPSGLQDHTGRSGQQVRIVLDTAPTDRFGRG